ncbi:terminase large subunit domain-containing protein [Microvirga terricola]|uniref:Mu-like prophage FluMu protein gp28 n=1 Tax=Microvirga terricola TaxID=2719797 RepID=A0ABX0V6R0_9HYPH|nr:terminase family protein [Microvirga terricola]NIX75397.1 hypothetical protein [Microvirga terricola]
MSRPITDAEWAKLRQDSISILPEQLSNGLLPDALLTYQKRAVDLLETTAVLLVEKSRRIGFTWGLAAYAVLRAARSRSAGGMDGMYISYSQEMTREFIDAAAMWAKAFALAAGEMDTFIFDDADPDNPADTRQIQAFRIRFASGFEIVALSSAPRSLRGKQGFVIVDEAAFVDNLKELMKAALAFLMWGGQVIVVSTHNGADNYFNELIQDVHAGRKPYTHMRIDFDQALLDGLYQRICLVTGKEWTAEAEAEWRAEIVAFYGDGADEELFCEPAQGDGVWLPATLIEARMTADAPIIRWELPENFLSLPELKRQGLVEAFEVLIDEALANLDPDEPHAIGFDFARVADLSVLTVLAIRRRLERALRLVIEMRRIPHREQAAITQRVAKRLPRFLGGAFDATGAGEFVAEDMVRIYGGRVSSIKMSIDWYRTEMPPLKAAFEDNTIAIARDRDHLADLRLVRNIKGVARVPDVRTGEKGKKRHGDFAVSLALAYHATQMDIQEFGYEPVIGGDPTSTNGSFRDDFEDRDLSHLPRLRGHL